MRHAAILLVLLFSLPASASFTFEPANPTDESYVVLQIRDLWYNVCGPGKAEVSRSGNRIDVRWPVHYVVGCFNRIGSWSDDVGIGVLEAGEYEVVLNADGHRATLPLVVTDASPAVTLNPNVLSSTSPTDVTVNVPRECLTDAAVVNVDNITVPSRVQGCSLIATFPALAPGAASVTVRIGTREFTNVTAARYIDPAAAPDVSLYERVLIPVLFNGPGAFGSQWETDVQIVNESSGARAPSLEGVGNRLNGLILFIRRDYDLRFGAVFRDVSRDAQQWGTELPIVREREFQQPIILPNVPFDRVVEVSGPCTNRREPCNSDAPAYGSIDLGTAFPDLTGRQQIRIGPATFDFTRRIWAFVTVTNNETQQVTVITPQ